MSSYGNIPTPDDAHVTRGYGAGGVAVAQDFAHGQPIASSPISQSLQQSNAFADFDQAKRESSFVSDASPVANRSASAASTAAMNTTPSRSNTLRKKTSMRRAGSLKRSSSRRSLRAGSIKGVDGVDDQKHWNSPFHTPIPTEGTPTDVLADRFQAWRQFLKSLITYFREIQSTYEARAKAIYKVQNTLSNIAHPAVFNTSHGLADASKILEDYHRRSIAEANKSREIENDVIGALTGLRSDLAQKVKEIKSLRGDFKNSVDCETDVTRREIEKLSVALQHVGHDDAGSTGKNDPYVVRLGVERAIEKQIDEENYLHRAYLNLENSGRELESIVVGEVQKAYNALAGILRREADDAYTCVEGLRSGPIAMPKDQDWLGFVVKDPHFVDPELPLRRAQDIDYPGKHDPAATEIRAGMLERKSKYLKSYSPGWYVLSPTHLHEFKSADKIHSQPPVMSLPLSEQKLGSKSEPGSSSHKFMLKGKQSGGMHKGHNWVFRAESHDTMLAWFEDIYALTEKTGAERNAFVRKHARSVSGNSERGTVSTDGGLEDDEADAAPYSGANSLAALSPSEEKPVRPQPGGRFPSDLRIPLATGVANERVSEDSEADTAPQVLSSPQEAYAQTGQDPYRLAGVASHTRATSAGSGVESYAPTRDSYRLSLETPQTSEFPQTAATTTSTVSSSPPARIDEISSPVGQTTFVQPAAYSQPPTHTVSTQPQELSADEAPAAHSTAPISAPQPTHDVSPLESATPLAAAGIVAAGAGVAGAGAYRQHSDETLRPTEPVDKDTQANITTPFLNGGLTVPPEPSQPRHSETSSISAVSSLTDDTVAGEAADVVSPISPLSANTTATSTTVTELGGLEKEGARETGRAIPVIRHRSDMSISGLHVPGGFPKRE